MGLRISALINQKVVRLAIAEAKQIKQGNPEVIASEIYGVICSTLVYKERTEEINIMKLYKEYENKNKYNRYKTKIWK